MNNAAPNPKEILHEILNAFCLVSQNTNKVRKLTGIEIEIPREGMYITEMHKIILSKITDEQAKDVINKMPFCYIENYSRTGDEFKEKVEKLHNKEKSCHFWIENVLSELPKKKGYAIENPRTGFKTFYR